MSRSNRARNGCSAIALLVFGFLLSPAETPRHRIPLDGNWRSTAALEELPAQDRYPQEDYNDAGWRMVSVPHNWDGYEGFRQLKHGNHHGTAWYRKTFALPETTGDERIFLYFEGVGSFATVWVNGLEVGSHAGGLTTFTLDITGAARPGGSNLLAVRADHPSGIRTLPWVCGGCEEAYGFSEGTQPFGISRPVHVVITDSLRIEPWGVHVWNGQDISRGRAGLHISTEVRNHGDATRRFRLRHRLLDAHGKEVLQRESAHEIAAGPGDTVILQEAEVVLDRPRLWSPGDPYLYTLRSEILAEGRVVDRLDTPYGIRWIEWPDPHGPAGKPLLLNGEPVFLNGVADYEHLLGESHAFTPEQVAARASQVMAAGFNAFRDAHHPHNLRFNEIWDREGILWWTQFGAHIWFDTPLFQETYKALLRDWIRERRNSPSLFLYTLQNESKLPTDFAAECAAIIREMDPTASTQRLIVTCNGGSGTDWDVPQNWSGTYGGDLFAYTDELIEQRMVGEYGAWRSLEFHAEGGVVEDGPLTEDRMAALMETKVRLGEKARGRAIGHFAWPFTTHQNPGRNVGSLGQQTRDGIREWDRIGPANNKGLLTIWGEPLDVFYMYRSNYVPVEKSPMVYIGSHTWPDRWTEPGVKNGIIVYSNAAEVELYNGYRGRSLGVRRRNGPGTHFRWDGALIETNILYAEARVDGRTVATDIVELHHLPQDTGLAEWDPDPPNLTLPEPEYTYLYRVNAGGEAYTDLNGSRWQADRDYREGDTWGSLSWARRFPNLPPAFGSKREIFDPVAGTEDDPLFRSFRYGRDELFYTFSVPEGSYRIELYFIEPWYGTGGGIDCTGWRLFDVAVNGEVVLPRLDLWAEAGRARAVRKVVEATARDGRLVISFPEVYANQAVISAIAIAGTEPVDLPPAPARLIENLATPSLRGTRLATVRAFLDTGMQRYLDSTETIHSLSWELREAEWIQTSRVMQSARRGKSAPSTNPDPLLQFNLTAEADVFVVHDPRIADRPEWLQSWDRTGLHMATTGDPDLQHLVFRKRFAAGETVALGPNADSPDAGGMYTVVVKPHYPPPPSTIIKGFTVHESKAPGQWESLGNLQAGRRLYSDGGPVISRFTTRLGGVDWIRPPRADADNPLLDLSFHVEDHTEVFVGLDGRIEHPPQWMRDWVPTEWELQTSGGGHGRLRFYKQRYKPGDEVVLGPNASLPAGSPVAMYAVLVRSVRPDKLYPPPAHEGSPMDWEISVGAGDRYGLNFRYRSRSSKPIVAGMKIISRRDGQLVCESTVTFQPTFDGEWAVSRNRTCDDINAGTYFIRLISEELAAIEFTQLQVE